MSLMKQCQEILLSGSEQDKYQVCAFLIKTAASYEKHTSLKSKRRFYEEQIC